MLAGAYGMVTLHWGWLLGMVFCMGLNSIHPVQSCAQRLHSGIVSDGTRPWDQRPVQAGHHRHHPVGHCAGRRGPGSELVRHSLSVRPLARSGYRPSGSRGGTYRHYLSCRTPRHEQRQFLSLVQAAGFLPPSARRPPGSGPTSDTLRRSLFLFPVHAACSDNQ